MAKKRRQKLSLVWLGLLLGLIALSACVQGPAKTSAPTIRNSQATSNAPPALTASSTPPMLPPVETSTPTFGYKVIKVYPHDPESYTEGLAFQGGMLYESSGRYGLSDLREVALESGRVAKLHKLPDVYFGEGLTVYNNTLFQLTWESGVGFIYDIKSFALDEVFSYQGEGWGLTTDGQRLIVSDGTANLQFWDPKTLEPIGSVQVNDHGKSIDNLNELEYIQGQVYANVWQTDKVAIINPQDGQVSAWLDLSGLLQLTDFKGEADVLNGIAYDEQNDRLFVTGKLWPYLFQIKMKD
jgi:glutamine cyclotransferase